MTATSSTADSNESLDFLIAMMGGNIDRKAAQRVLAKFNGDVEKAADSLANGEAPPPESWDSSSLLNFSDGYAPPPSSPVPKPKRLLASLPTIDLTMDDDPPQHHPEWAVVRSNAAVDLNSQITKDLDTQNDDIHRAIEASLAHADSVEEIEEELPPEDRVRKDNRPVVLRPQDHRFAHVGLLWQALFFVPQVRERIAGYRGPLPSSMILDDTGVLEVEPPKDGPEGQLWSLVELFSYMELATLAELTGMPALARFKLSPWSNGLLGSQNSDMLKDLSWTIETVLDNGIATLTPSWYRLFHCRYTMNEATEDEWDSHPINTNSDASVITVTYDNDEESNDLISCLSNQLLPREDQEASGTPSKEVITHPADVLSFYPVRDEGLPSYPTASSEKKNGERRKFRYPKSFYLDRFMQENERHVRERSITDKDMLEEVERLESRKHKLTRYENHDVIKNLRASIYYYEEIAEASEDDIQRRAIIDTMAVKLKRILAKIEAEITTIDKEVSSLKIRSDTLFDSPELQKYRYDLRAVLMHDGLYGRKHIYSYVQQDGIWWKTLDHSVTQVSEDTVLNDRTGLHLGAGPYLLLYSLFVPDELRTRPTPWPDVLQEGARRDSENFLNELPPEVRSRVYNPMASQSPLTPKPHDEINGTPGRMDMGA